MASFSSSTAFSACAVFSHTEIKDENVRREGATPRAFISMNTSLAIVNWPSFSQAEMTELYSFNPGVNPFSRASLIRQDGSRGDQPGEVAHQHHIEKNAR